jgi:DNA-binding response OmpR family regulator
MALVLVIDDEPQMRRMIRRILSAAEHDAIEASNGREGLAMFQKYRPDIVVTDILMPEKEGIETILEIRRATAATGIIAISGGGVSDNLMFLDIAKKFGADAVLAKPFRAQELIDAVAGLLAQG